MRVFHSQEIKDEAQVGAARRAVHRYASQLGFGDEQLCEIDIVVQEVGTNAARYADGGGCLHWTTTHGADAGLELFYTDRGPGIYDLERAFRDGVSSGGGLGTGFGAMRRLLDEFEAYSSVKGTTRKLSQQRRPTYGTALLGRKWLAGRDERELARARLLAKHVGAWSRARPGEESNGDAYFICEHEGETLLAVVDGLGHGRGAREAAQAALDMLAQWRGESLDEMVWAVHDALRTTRGAVMGAVVVDRERGSFNYAGVGNVETRVLGSQEPARPIPSNGTLGARLSQVRVWPHRWAEGMTLVLASDGLSATWDMGAYPGLLTKSPQMLAGVLLRDFSRNSDDATVLVYR
jgi:anti-sigma regulatory factor (Ser/Thr protein kinase)/serine/threonine protein phosphatase PrpC